MIAALLTICLAYQQPPAHVPDIASDTAPPAPLRDGPGEPEARPEELDTYQYMHPTDDAYFTAQEKIIPLEIDTPPKSGHSNVEIWFSFGVLLFGLIMIGLQIWLMIHNQKYWDTTTFRIFTVTLAVTASMFLITAGYSNDQILPVISLVSGVVGYVFGNRTETPTGH